MATANTNLADILAAVEASAGGGASRIPATMRTCIGRVRNASGMGVGGKYAFAALAAPIAADPGGERALVLTGFDVWSGTGAIEIAYGCGVASSVATPYVFDDVVAAANATVHYTHTRRQVVPIDPGVDKPYARVLGGTFTIATSPTPDIWGHRKLDSATHLWQQRFDTDLQDGILVLPDTWFLVLGLNSITLSNVTFYFLEPVDALAPVLPE